MSKKVYDIYIYIPSIYYFVLPFYYIQSKPFLPTKTMVAAREGDSTPFPYAKRHVLHQG